MPKLKGYSSQAGLEGPTPGRRATEGDVEGFGRAGLAQAADTAATGQSMQVVGQALGQLGDQLYLHEARSEVSNARATIAQIHAEEANALREAAAKAQPGDTSFADSYYERLTNRLQESAQGFKTAEGRRVYAEMSSGLAAQFRGRAVEYQAELAGVQASQNYVTELNSYRSALRSDPTQFDFVLKQLQTGLNDPASPYAAIPAKDRAVLYRQTAEQLAFSAARGYIDLNPEFAKKKLEAGWGSEYLDSDNRDQLLNEADRGIRLQEAESERRAQVEEQRIKAEQEKTKREFVLAAMDGKLTDTMIKRSNLDARDIEHYAGMVRQWARASKADANANRLAGDPTLKDDPNVLSQIVNRTQLPEGHPDKISNIGQLAPFFTKGLGIRGFTFATGLLNGKGTPDGETRTERIHKALSAIESQFTNSPLETQTQLGKRKYQVFYQEAYATINKAREDGKEIGPLLDPLSPEYIGKTANQYIPTRQEYMDEMRAQNSRSRAGSVENRTRQAPAAAEVPAKQPPRLPGETHLEYERRVLSK